MMNIYAARQGMNRQRKSAPVLTTEVPFEELSATVEPFQILIGMTTYL